MNTSRFSLFLRTAVVISLLAVSAAPSADAAPERIKIKLGTLAPDGTAYHKLLRQMGEAWRHDSNGAIELKILAGGKSGSESDMVGLMQINQLQAAMLTAVGLAQIEPDVVGLQNIPMAFRDLDEVGHVGRELQPVLEKRMAARGFVALCWSDAGWVRFFSTQPVALPDDLRKLKLFNWAGSQGEAEVQRSAGFKPVSLETADIVPGLTTGLIEAVAMPPFFALAGQVDLRASYMLELNWAPLVGALVMRRETWEGIPPEVRTAMRAAAGRAGEQMKAAGRRESKESIAAMEKRGLEVVKVTPEIEAKWRRTAESFYPAIRGRIVPAGIFDDTMAALAAHRAEKEF